MAKQPVAGTPKKVGLGTIIEGLFQGNISQEINNARVRDLALQQAQRNGEMQQMYMSQFGRMMGGVPATFFRLR